jgi:hypothetical protein
MVLEGRLVRTSSAENASSTSSVPCICLRAFLCGAISGGYRGFHGGDRGLQEGLFAAYIYLNMRRSAAQPCRLTCGVTNDTMAR